MIQALYAVDEASDLYGFTPPDGTIFISNGKNSRDDRPPLNYEYTSSSMATDDGDNVIRPTSISVGSPGRYLKRAFDYAALQNLPALSAVAISGSYTDLISKPTIPASVSLSTTGTSGNATFNSGTGVLNVPNYTPAARSFATPSRALSTTGANNTFTVSTTRDAIVAYTINFSASLTLTTSTGVVSLDYSLDAGTTWINVDQVSQTFGVSITITTSQSLRLSGMIPANALVRINRVSNTNVTISIPTGSSNTYQQEVLL